MSAHPATDLTASDHATQPSFDLSSYVAASRAHQDEVAPQTISPRTVAFCAVGALAVVPLTSAQAAIVTKAVGGNTVDVGSNGVDDFKIIVATAGSREYFIEAQVLNDVGVKAYRSATNKTVGTEGGMVDPAETKATIYKVGGLLDSFQAGANNYVPVKFRDANINGGSTVYGWAQIDVKSNSDIVEIVYSDVGHFVNLNAGAFSEVPPVPEPSTLALMATGAAGVLALRRRRREQKKEQG